MPKAQELLYAAVGTGDLAVEKVRSLKRLRDPRVNKKLYEDVVGRGRTLSRKVRTAPATKTMLAQTDAARRQVRDATKTVTKAFGVNIVSWPESRRTNRTTSGATSKKKTQARKTTAKAS